MSYSTKTLVAPSLFDPYENRDLGSGGTRYDIRGQYVYAYTNEFWKFQKLGSVNSFAEGSRWNWNSSDAQGIYVYWLGDGANYVWCYFLYVLLRDFGFGRNYIYYYYEVR